MSDVRQETAPKLRQWTLARATIQDPLRWRKPAIIELDWDTSEFKSGDTVLAVIAMAAALKRDHVFLLRTADPAALASYVTTEHDPKHFPGEDWGDRLAAAFYALTHDDDHACRVANSVHDLLGTGHNAGWPLGNLLNGVLLRSQADADRLLPALLGCPGRTWVDVVPGEGIDLSEIPVECACGCWAWNRNRFDSLYCAHCESPKRPLALDFVRVQGEAEPIHPDWVRGLRDQCEAAGVTFHFVGWGDWLPLGLDGMNYGTLPSPSEIYAEGRFRGWLEPDGEWYSLGIKGDTRRVGFCRVGRARSGCELDGRRYEAWPEVGR